MTFKRSWIRAKESPGDLENHIRAAFMNGMMLGARLQAKLPESSEAQNGWCVTPEKSQQASVAPAQSE